MSPSSIRQLLSQTSYERASFESCNCRCAWLFGRCIWSSSSSGASRRNPGRFYSHPRTVILVLEVLPMVTVCSAMALTECWQNVARKGYQNCRLRKYFTSVPEKLKFSILSKIRTLDFLDFRLGSAHAWTLLLAQGRYFFTVRYR